MCKLKHLAVAAAIVGLATHVQAGYFPGSTDFEGDDPLSGDLWSNVGESEIVADASVASVPRAANLPPDFNTTIRTNVLGVDGDTPIVRDLQADGTAPTAATIYADALVKGYPLAADASAPEAGTSDKILVYTRIIHGGTDTNLCVLAAASDIDSTATEFVLTKSIGKDEWHRIVIKATAAGYQVYCDGTDAADLCKTAGDVATFYALNTGDPMTSIAFQGTGYVDDLILSDLDPAKAVYTLTWDTSFTAVSYTIDGITTNALTVADGTYSFQAPDNTAVTIIGNNGYRPFTDTYTTDSSAPTHTVAAPTGLAYYTDGDGTAANPYEIPCYAALVAMQQAVASTASYRSAHYVQTEDIDAAGEPAFAGIGTYNATPTGGTPFTGTYDGQGYKISDITMTVRNYGGIFNQVNGGTIKNLTVENISVPADASGEYGFAIVGNAGNGATLQNLVAEGSFLSAAKPGTHNMAGIVIRVSGGTTGDGTQILNCTNNATIYGTYTKLAGICAISQEKMGDLAKMVFAGCANNGELVLNRTGEGITGFAGIVGYSDVNTVMTDCSNTGVLTQQGSGYNTDCTGALIGMTYGHSITDGGNNSAPANKKMIGKWAGATETGFKYATVGAGVATTIAPPYTPAVGNTYLLEGNAVAADAPVATLTAPGQTIAFDELLGYTNVVGMVDATAPLAVILSTDGTLKTYTAALTAATWIGGAQGDWETNTNWSVGYVPTKDTVVTFTNDAQVAILSSTDRCKELVLSNANVTLVRDANATRPVLHFHGNEGRAVSVASGATGSLGVNNLALFTESTDRNNNLTIGCALAVLGDVTFRGINIIPNQLAASFTITGKTTVSANATVKTIDWGNTVFLGGIEVAKGVTAKIQTDPNGYAQIGAAVTLVANDGEGDSTAIWLMRSSNRSGKVSLVLKASVSVDADHAATYYIKTSSAEVTDEHGLNPITCDVYTATRNPTVFVTTNGVTVAGVENEQKVIPGTNLVISVSGFAEGYEPSVTIMKHEDYSVLLATNAVSFTYTMPDFDIDVVATATAPSFKDPENREIEDPAIVGWLLDNGFSQGDIDALGHDAAATDKLYECYLLNCSITVQNPGGALSITAIAVSNKVSITVQLVRQKPLGFINGVLHVYGADNLAAGFSRSPISEEIVGFSDGNSIFDTDPADGAVTQSVTANFSPTDVTAKFFKAVIEFPIADNGDGEGGEEEGGGEE